MTDDRRAYIQAYQDAIVVAQESARVAQENVDALVDDLAHIMSQTFSMTDRPLDVDMQNPKCPANEHFDTTHGCICNEGRERAGKHNKCLVKCKPGQVRTRAGRCKDTDDLKRSKLEDKLDDEFSKALDNLGL